MELGVTVPDLNKFVTRLGGLVGKDRLREAAQAAARQTAHRLYDALVLATPARSGRTRDAWRLLATGDGYAIINTLRTAKWLIEGQEDYYQILPRRKKALRFTTGGSTVFAKRVNHPPNRPNARLRATWERARRDAFIDQGALRDFIRSEL